MNPSPHAAAWQRTAGVGQIQPSSILQSALQPSPLLVLLSSHFSAPEMVPSPQTVVFTQGLFGSGQIQPSSNRHVEPQPSAGSVLPSSHCSPAGTFKMPSPQTTGGAGGASGPGGGAESGTWSGASGMAKTYRSKLSPSLVLASDDCDPGSGTTGLTGRSFWQPATQTVAASTARNPFRPLYNCGSRMKNLPVVSQIF